MQIFLSDETAIIFSHFEKLKGRGNIYEIFFIFKGVNVYKKGINLKTVNLHTKWGVNEVCRTFL